MINGTNLKIYIMKNYFSTCKNANELKSLFRKLCNELHPDKGGNSKEFIAMMDEYNNIKDSFNSSNDSENINANEFYNILEQLNKLENCTIDFVGSFIWIFGDTYKQKDLIKSFILDGFNTARYASAKKAWYFSPVGYERKGRKSYDMDEIKNKYGCKSYNSVGTIKIG